MVSKEWCSFFSCIISTICLNLRWVIVPFGHSQKHHACLVEHREPDSWDLVKLVVLSWPVHFPCPSENELTSRTPLEYISPSPKGTWGHQAMAVPSLGDFDLVQCGKTLKAYAQRSDWRAAVELLSTLEAETLMDALEPPKGEGKIKSWTIWVGFYQNHPKFIGEFKKRQAAG